MEGHQVIGVHLLDGTCEGIPAFHTLVAHDVAANHPDDVWLVFVAIADEMAVFCGFLRCETLDLSTPYAVHGDVDALPCGHVHDVVEMIPIAVDAGLGVGREVKAVVEGLLPEDIERGIVTVEHLYLFYVVALLMLAGEVELHLVAIQPFGHEPCRVAQPEEWRAVFMHEILVVVRHA